MNESPRLRRLRNDLTALERLKAESSVFRFAAQGSPPQKYQIVFRGKSLQRDRGKVRSEDVHRVEIKLGASYPRTMPEIRWVTPIYHPNISEIGMVCLGGYGTHWVPSLQLDELCNMLWDMARYHNYDIRSPYNRDAALWVASQTTFLFPTDSRPLRDLRAARGREDFPPERGGPDKPSPPDGPVNGPTARSPARPEKDQSTPDRVRQFVNRYGAMFIAGGDPASRRRPRNGDADRAGVAALGQVVRRPDPVSSRSNSQKEEIILLESATPAHPPADPPVELLAEGGDGITFID
jgi:ubiquitin-protein ligase